MLDSSWFMARLTPHGHGEASLPGVLGAGAGDVLGRAGATVRGVTRVPPRRQLRKDGDQLVGLRPGVGNAVARRTAPRWKQVLSEEPEQVATC